MGNILKDKRNIIIALLTVIVALEFAFIYKLRQDVNDNFQKIETLKHIITAVNNDVNTLKKDLLPIRFDYDKKRLDAERDNTSAYDYEKHNMQQNIKDLQDEVDTLKANR